jgi:hypothetical protein
VGPARIEDDTGLRAVAAAAVADGLALLDPARGAVAPASVQNALGAPADTASDRAALEPLTGAPPRGRTRCPERVRPDRAALERLLLRIERQAAQGAGTDTVPPRDDGLAL